MWICSPGRGRLWQTYVDVADLCLSLVRASADSFIEAARALGDFLDQPEPPLVSEREGKGRPFIVDHGRNAGVIARLNGISLYAPHVAPDRDFDAVRPLYNFDFSRKRVGAASCTSSRDRVAAHMNEEEIMAMMHPTAVT